MLNYQSTSFHDALVLRRLLALKRAPEFEAWLQRMQVTDGAGGLRAVGASHPLLLSMEGGAGGPSAGPLPSRPAIPPRDWPAYPTAKGPA
jgi:hypothetical protein